MNRSFSRVLGGVALAVSLVAGGMGTAGAQSLGSSVPPLPDPAPNSCAPNILVSVPGGANTVSNAPSNLPLGLYTRTVGAQLRHSTGGRVVDRYASYNSLPGGFRTYEQVRQDAYNSTRNLLARSASECPNAKFSLLGYSLGSDISSLLVRDIAAGRGPISADHLTSAVLIANPNRGVPGVEQQGTAPQHTAGAFGALPGGYGSLNNRVVDVCRQGDIVCDTPANLSPVAGEAAKTALLSFQSNLGPAAASLGRLNPIDQLTAVPTFILGSQIHIDYDAINATGIATEYIRTRLA